MAAYIRELLDDIVHLKLKDSLIILDVVNSLNALLKNQIIRPDHIQCVTLFAEGYTVSELMHMLDRREEEIETMLIQTWCSLEKETGYTDWNWLERALTKLDRQWDGEGKKPSECYQKSSLMKSLLTYERNFDVPLEPEVNEY